MLRDITCVSSLPTCAARRCWGHRGGSPAAGPPVLQCVPPGPQRGGQLAAAPGATHASAAGAGHSRGGGRHWRCGGLGTGHRSCKLLRRLLLPLHLGGTNSSVANVLLIVFAGLILAPMLAAPKDVRGPQFVPSMALGVLVVSPALTALLTCAPRHAFSFSQASVAGWVSGMNAAGSQHCAV